MKTRFTVGLMIPLLLLVTAPAGAENIDPYETASQYAWNENTGWLDFEPSPKDGTRVTAKMMTGCVFGSNVAP